MWPRAGPPAPARRVTVVPDTGNADGQLALYTSPSTASIESSSSIKGRNGPRDSFDRLDGVSRLGGERLRLVGGRLGLVSHALELLVRALELLEPGLRRVELG